VAIIAIVCGTLKALGHKTIMKYTLMATPMARSMAAKKLKDKSSREAVAAALVAKQEAEAAAAAAHQAASSVPPALVAAPPPIADPMQPEAAVPDAGATGPEAAAASDTADAVPSKRRRVATANPQAKAKAAAKIKAAQDKAMKNAEKAATQGHQKGKGKGKGKDRGRGRGGAGAAGSDTASSAQLAQRSAIECFHEVTSPLQVGDTKATERPTTVVDDIMWCIAYHTAGAPNEVVSRVRGTVVSLFLEFVFNTEVPVNGKLIKAYSKFREEAVMLMKLSCGVWQELRVIAAGGGDCGGVTDGVSSVLVDPDKLASDLLALCIKPVEEVVDGTVFHTPTARGCWPLCSRTSTVSCATLHTCHRWRTQSSAICCAPWRLSPITAWSP